MKRNPADQHETMIWRNQNDTVTWLAVSVSLPTLLGYQRASAFVNAIKLASQPQFSSDEEYKISNVLSNTFFIDIDHVSIAIHIVIVLSPSPSWNSLGVFSGRQCVTEVSCCGQLGSHTSPAESHSVSSTIFKCILSIKMRYSVL